jgi:catechol 2,3-dioxygenase-like lactoylglutathione lyase family enzyme
MKSIVTKLHHTGITVRDTEESLAFYREFLGIEKVGECFLSIDDGGKLDGVKIKISFLAVGEDSLELLEYVHPQSSSRNELNPWDPGNQHVSFKVDDIHGLYERSRDKVNFLSSPIDYKTEGIDTTWVYAKDPNGTLIELSEDHDTRYYE